MPPPSHRRAPWDQGEHPLARPIQTGFFFTMGVGAALLGYYLVTNVGSLMGWVVTATFIALGLDPLVQWFERKGMPRALAATTVLLTVAIAVTMFILFMVPRMIEQAQQLVAQAPQLVDQFMESQIFRALDDQLNVATAFENATRSLQQHLSSDQDFLGGIFGSVVSVGGIMINAVTGTLIVMALSMYFLFTLPLTKAWVYRLAPASRRDRVEELGNRMTSGVGHYVVGQACVALINASVAFIVMLFTGVPYATLLVTFVVCLAFIPLVGGVLAGVLVTLIALTASWDTAAIYALCYFAYLQVEAYFVSPRIMSRAVAVPGAVAVIAVAAGGALWGVLGALIAIPTAAAGLMLVREVFIPRQDAR